MSLLLQWTIPDSAVGVGSVQWTIEAVEHVMYLEAHGGLSNYL